MDLDDELRRIFADDRLDVAVRPDAQERIVAGARRARLRRRMAVTGATGGVAVAALVAGAVLFTDPGPPDAMPPAERTTSRPAPTTSGSAMPSATPQSPPPSATGSNGKPRPGNDPATTAGTKTKPPTVRGMQIGPTGFGVMYLGMSFDEAKAVSATEGEPPPPENSCTQYPLLLDGEPAGNLYFSSAGVEAISPTPDLHTAEGVSQGWTVAQVNAVYPDVTEELVADYGRVLVPAPGNSGANYRLQFADGVLTGIILQSVNQPCYE